MILIKGGIFLVFCKEGSFLGDVLILNKFIEVYKFLWLIEKIMLNKDFVLE